MVKYVENQFNEEYTQTLGVNFMEKTISIRNTEITFSIWDLGGQKVSPQKSEDDDEEEERRGKRENEERSWLIVDAT